MRARARIVAGKQKRAAIYRCICSTDLDLRVGYAVHHFTTIYKAAPSVEYEEVSRLGAARTFIVWSIPY